MSDSLASQSDAELLKRFSKTRCERVFEELVSRYGRLVMAICLRNLRNQHDAEDVFQATFLVLAEKAGSIRKRNSLSSWLTGTAHRLSIKLAQKRHRKDLALAAEPIAAREQFSDLEKRFDEQAMDEELHALPSKYRDVLVRFYFLGETSRQIAESLGITQGAADGRIKRGRQELRVRLAKRGVALGALTVMALSAQTASAAVAPTLVQSVAQAAVAKSAAGLCSPSVVKLAGTELMKTTSLASSAAITCSTIALLAASTLGLNAAFAQSMASGVAVINTQVAGSSGTATTMAGVFQQARKADADDMKPREARPLHELYAFGALKANDVIASARKVAPNATFQTVPGNRLLVGGTVKDRKAVRDAILEIAPEVKITRHGVIPAGAPNQPLMPADASAEIEKSLAEFRRLAPGKRAESYKLLHHPAADLVELWTQLHRDVPIGVTNKGNTVIAAGTDAEHTQIKQALAQLDRKETKLAKQIDTADIYEFEKANVAELVAALRENSQTGLVDILADNRIAVVGSDDMRKQARIEIEKVEKGAFKKQFVSQSARNRRWQYVYRLKDHDKLIDTAVNRQPNATFAFNPSGHWVVSGTGAEQKQVRELFEKAQPGSLIGRTRLDVPLRVRRQVARNAFAPAPPAKNRQPNFATAKLSQDGRSIAIDMPNDGKSVTENYTVNVPVNVNGRIVSQQQTKTRTVVPAGPSRRLLKFDEVMLTTVGGGLPTPRQLRQQLDGKKPILLGGQKLSEFQWQTLRPSMIVITVPDADAGKTKESEAEPQARTVRPLGLDLAPVDHQTRRLLVDEKIAGGLRVVRVVEGSVADKQGIRPGDILIGLNIWKTTGFRDLDYVLEQEATWTNKTRFYVLRAKGDSGYSRLFGSMRLAGLKPATKL